MKSLFAHTATVTLLACLLSATLQAQQPTPSPEQAPQLLSMLDQDGDKKLSQDEAQGGLKDNFALIDGNGDGGIDLEELTRILKMVAGQSNSGASSEAEANPLEGTGEPSFGKRNMEQIARMQALSAEEDREFFMVNLIKYRAKAKYADGRETDLTGEQADGLYAPVDFLAEIGAKVAYVGSVTNQLGHMEPAWNRVAIVLYPTRAKFFEMVSNPEFQKRSEHKEAGLEVSQVLLTEREPWTLGKDSASQSEDQDDAFMLVQLWKYREFAKYDDSDEPKRTGREAMDAFDVASKDILHEVGAKAVLRARVEGAVIGDGRTWDEFRLLYFPSQAAFSSALEKIGSAMKHRDGAMEDDYLLMVKTTALNIAD